MHRRPRKPISNRRIGAASVAALCGLSLLGAGQGGSTPVDRWREIAPILRTGCLECHSGNDPKAGLRLDRRDAAFAGSGNGKFKVIRPGSASTSPLYLRLLSEDPEVRMPKRSAALPAEAIEKVRAWIDEGAKWPAGLVLERERASRDHWAYRKPERPALPQVREESRARNPIDRFVLARLEKEGLEPSPEANRATLLRRVSLDLVGLPPSPEEVAAFEADGSPDAYEKQVDRLLGSPHFGERWARPWLDLARYADTDGYEKDLRRTAWKWRDWVIRALNEDMPFDRFTVEQVAGDMLPDATLDQRIASGFHRNTLHNREGGVDQDEARYLVLVDRVATTGTVWLGTTLACAQCHDHKYDPFTQKEFHQLLAFFETTEYEAIGDASVGEAKYTEPSLEAPTMEEEARRAALRLEIEEARRMLGPGSPPLEAEQAAWEKEPPVDWTVLVPEPVRSEGGATLSVLDDGSVLASGANPDSDAHCVTVRTRLQGITSFRLEMLPDPSLPSKGPGRAYNGNLVLTGFGVRAGEEPLPLSAARADHEQDRFPVAGAIDSDPATGWALLEETGKPHVAVFELASPLEREEGTLVFTLEYRSRYAEHAAGRFRLSATRAKNLRARALVPEGIEAILRIPRGERTLDQAVSIAAFHRSNAPCLDPVRERLRRARKDLEALEASIPRALVMSERPSHERPATLLRVRGSFVNPGERVYAGTPSILHAFPRTEMPNRLGLARWLASAENPLVARVTVNRLWQEIFGRGIVETSEDFGTRGSPPTHPELLDWLAVEFVERGWSVKAILREVVTSATYRQSSAASRERRERDPENRLLARGPRFRLEAEAVRDVALEASGLLDRRIGGPSVFPYQPPGIWRLPYNDDRWVESEGGDRHRRGLYTFWRRSAPYPSMAAYDAGSREACLSRRPRTNTPLQALAVLNDPAFFEAARALAGRMIAEGGEGPEGRATRGFRLCTGRSPEPEEVRILLDLLGDERARAGGKDGADRAAWTIVANALLNLDETLTKE
ncbi:MAG TPA: PSD1 and planctomycete cytochrome C domain-containing protein [Planctomycetota bacterium]|nr:PSD1 and planctomycete cytochrome C domain-containing protein [Planctomycetota bacterium]